MAKYTTLVLIFILSLYNATSESPKSGEAVGEVKAPIVLKAPTTIVIKVE